MPNSTSYFLSPDPMSPADGPSIIAFFVLQIIGGNVLIPVMVLASFVRGNKYSRSPIFMNFCIGWIAYSISFMLSFYSGRWRRDLEPIPWLCEVEAVLIFVAPVWTAAATCALIFDLWVGVTRRKRSSSSNQSRDRIPLRTLMLVIFPYFCAIFMAVAASLVSQARRDLVGFRTISCTIDFQPLRTTVSVFCSLGLGLGFVLQFDIGRRLYGRPSFATPPSQDLYHKFLFIRMLIFLFVLAIGLLAAFLGGVSRYKYPRRIIQAALPLAVWLVFGTNPAMYKRDSGPMPTSKSNV